MERKEDRRIERTKDILRKTLLELVSENGYSNVRVKDIVERANYNRTTFYVHYDGKEELAQEIIDLEMEDFVHEFCKPLIATPVLDLRTMSPNGMDIFRHIKSRREFYDLLKAEDTLPNIGTSLLNNIKDIFQNKMDFQGEFSDELNAQYFIDYRSYGIYGFINEWVNKRYNASPEEMSRRIINLLYYHSPIMTQIKEK